MGVYLGMGVFLAESSDLRHMGIYTGMSVISVWALLWANTVVVKVTLAVIHMMMSRACTVGHHLSDGHGTKRTSDN